MYKRTQDIKFFLGKFDPLILFKEPFLILDNYLKLNIKIIKI